MADLKAGDVTLIAMRLPERVIERFSADEQGVADALAFLKGSATGGVLYKLEHYEDKHGDILPHSTRLGEVDASR